MNEKWKEIAQKHFNNFLAIRILYESGIMDEDELLHYQAVLLGDIMTDFESEIGE